MKNSNKLDNNPIFVVGTGRCGSSLLHELIARHNEIGFISNIDDNLPRVNLYGRFNNLIFRTPIGQYTRKGRIRFAPSEAYRLIAHQVSPIYENSCRDLVSEDVTPWLESRFRKFFTRRISAQKKSKFLHKYTGWPRIGFFSTIFPEAKFINVIRDGRAVSNSWLQMPWWGGYRGPENWLWGMLPSHYYTEWKEDGFSYSLLAGISWKILMDAFDESTKNISSDRYLQIRYEDFVNNPYEILDTILSFIGIAWNPAFERQLNKKKLYTHRLLSYEKDLTSQQLDKLEKSLSGKLKQYNYLP